LSFIFNFPRYHFLGFLDCIYTSTF
jgi:hypothetical protein